MADSIFFMGFEISDQSDPEIGVVRVPVMDMFGACDSLLDNLVAQRAAWQDGAEHPDGDTGYYRAMANTAATLARLTIATANRCGRDTAIFVADRAARHNGRDDRAESGDTGDNSDSGVGDAA